MIWLSLVGFLSTVFASAAIIRWLGGRGVEYGDAMPQRFHVGEVPRLGGMALLAGVVASWLLLMRGRAAAR